VKPERWEQVERIYHAALESGEEERAAFLSRACAGDEELRREVESLLGYEAEAEDFIESPALEAAAKLMAPEEVAALAPGQTIDHYQIISALGAGGMGEVYLAEDTRLQRKVAIKMLPVAAARDPRSVRRFITEAKAASSLNHPNIVTVHEINQDGEIPFIVMEYVDGESLRESAGSAMPLPQFLDLAIQITSAIAAAHEAGIVHRDIKPANVMLSRTGRVKVVDFGLARLSLPQVPVSGEESTAEWQSRITRTGAIVGTPGYMSPEQVQGGSVDARSDIFSLGVLFHEMLSGRRLFKAGDPLSATVSILRDEPPSLRSGRKAIPAELDKLIRHALTKDPGDRDITAAQMHDELIAIRESLRPAGKGGRARFSFAIAAVALTLLGAGAGFWWWQQSRQSWLRSVALPEIQRKADADDRYGAFVLARRAREIAPDDPQLQQTWASLSVPLKIESEPSGAEVSMRSYIGSDPEWITLGRTPLKTFVPLAMVRFRVTHEGHVPLEAAPFAFARSHTFRLYRPDDTPSGMVAVPGGTVSFKGTSVELTPFWIDRYEVTNREFKRFIDEGGYRRRELWKHPIERDGRIVAWEDGVRTFVDVTGRPGPAHWELGTYPEGQDQHPVEGISWYEAAAYAEFAGKSLPTVYHWTRAAGAVGGWSDILTMSNFSGKGTAPVGSFKGLGPYGTYDMAGNVKEWCFNASGQQRFILGGSQADPPYQFMETDAQPPIERQRSSGLRLILERKEAGAGSRQPLPVVPPEELEPPVDNETFELFARFYDYDPSPLNARTDSVDDSHQSWRREIISIDAAYGGERLPVNLFIPKNATPPYQTVVYFPGSDAAVAGSSRHLFLRWVEFFLKSGRAVAFPIYKGTYERAGQRPTGPGGRRDLAIHRVKDVRRTVDYLTTRNDIDKERLAYYGISFGASFAPLVLAVEPRFETAVLVAGGLSQSNALPESQPLNFISHVTLPVLLVSGRNDFEIPYESEQKPLFERLGTPPKNKRHVVLESGHVPLPWNEVIRETLEWMDRWLGPVNVTSPRVVSNQ
jgi:formylglycine-generating enzyme required for sulfatase activity/predicted Ser/Thr protein kinase/predicted esterase